MRLAVIAGSALRASTFARGAERVEVGGIPMLDADGVLVLQRHGLDAYTPPHAIDHRAHARALHGAGVTHVVSLASVGALRAELSVGTCLLLDDFYAPRINLAFHDDERMHHVPRFDPDWSSTVAAAWAAATTTPLRRGGVYAQTDGPRFETPAEIRALARDADVVGMTVAAECMLCAEAAIAYAAIAVVDNLANGVAAEPLTMEEFHEGVASNRARLVADLDTLLPRLRSFA